MSAATLQAWIAREADEFFRRWPYYAPLNDEELRNRRIGAVPIAIADWIARMTAINQLNPYRGAGELERLAASLISDDWDRFRARVVQVTRLADQWKERPHVDKLAAALRAYLFASGESD